MLGVMALGLVAAAAAAPRDRFDPRAMAGAVRNRAVSWRSTTRGTLGLAAATAVAGVVVLMEPDGVLTLALHIAGLGLVFVGARMVVSLLPEPDADASSSSAPRHRRFLSTAVVVALLLGTGAVAIVVTQRSRTQVPHRSPVPAREAPRCAIGVSTRSRCPGPTTRCHRSSIPDGCSVNRSPRSALSSATASERCCSTPTTGAGRRSRCRVPVRR